MAVSVTLANNEYVIVYQTPDGVSFDVLNSSRTPVQVGTAVSTGATSWINAQALSDGGFTVEWTAQGVLMAEDFSAFGAATDQPHVETSPAPLALLGFTSSADGAQGGTPLQPTAPTAVLPLPAGGYVTGWIGGTMIEVGQIRQYNALGAAVAPMVQFTGPQQMQDPKFAVLADGSYLAEIVTDQYTIGAVYIDHLSAAGALLSQTTAYQAQVEGEEIVGYAISGLADGGYVLAWTAPETSNGTLLSTTGVYVEEFTAAGVAVHPTPELVGAAASANVTPLIEALPDGSYVVAWAGASGAQAQVFNEADAALNVQNVRAPIPAPHDAFSGGDRSDFLVENVNGAVVVGEVALNGQAAYSQIAALGPEWKFAGSGAFPAPGFLIDNTNNGDVMLATLQNGQAHYAQVATLGSPWSFVGVGDYLGQGSDQLLIENTSGAVEIGDLKSGQASYTEVAGLGAEWKFVGSGDYLGDGKDDFLISNSNNGAVDVGEVGANGKASFTQVAMLGSEWKFVGAGDYLGDGKTDFLIENSANGAVDVGEVGTGGKVSYTQVAALGSEWKFMGAGDYLGEGHDQFLIESATGMVVVGDIKNGQAAWTQVAALGSEWSFHG